MKRKAEEEPSGVLVWFRTDLRLHDNQALVEAIQYATLSEAPLRAVYVMSKEELAHIGPIRVDFILRTLRVLCKDLADLNVALDFLLVEQGLPSSLAEYCQEHGISTVFFNKECDPVAMARDVQVRKLLDQNGIGYQEFTDQCIVQEGFVLNKMGKPYAVFTPFKNCWLQYIQENPIRLQPAPLKMQQKSGAAMGIPERIPGFEMDKFDVQDILGLFPAGEHAALAKYKGFLESTGKEYKDTRNYPAMKGTSMASPYLAVGALSPRQAFELARAANHGKTTSGSEGLQTFISELCWRDFYRHVLFHFPHIARGEPFKAEATRIVWREDAAAEEDFARWCQGRTGVPIVDAAMAQLARTGWMHNRLRMVVSMFLTKDLLISWKRGESWFARHLIDYDWPSNNGGWQWSSSTGTDAQPYFRVFNPYTQSENYDKEGTFIKRFLPELEHVPAPAIHDPNTRLTTEQKAKLCPRYPATIVDHAAARLRALEVFKVAFKKI